MRCPNCDYSAYQPSQPCPECHFAGDPVLIEELARIDWVLTEIDTWQALGVRSHDRQLIQQKYEARQRELEIALGLRLPPFTAEEAQAAWPELFQRETLLQKMGEWLEAGLIHPTTTQTMVDQTQHQVDELFERLEAYARPPYPQTDTERLELVNFLLDAVDYLHQNSSFATTTAETQIRVPLIAEKEQLEIKLSLRPMPEPVSQPISEPTSQPEIQVEPEAVISIPPSASPHPHASMLSLPLASLSPRSPVPPLRDRLWRTLLSERTLQALLFLGIFLLFAAALSFVVWGWKDFSAPLRVAIPTSFTAIFFALGWYVRAKTPLYRSGVSLSAIAALLIPIDFYTVYVNFHIPPDYWPAFWLITSLACLVAYIIATFIIRSRFFGYLVGVAAGSTVLALIQVAQQAVGLSLDWRTAGLSLLALGLIVLATILEKRPADTSWPHLFAEPFRYLSLLTVGVLMPLTFGWRYLQRDIFDTLHYALTINWWVGGFTFGWGAVHYRSRSLGLLAAIALPLATYLTQAALFDQIEVNPAWHAFGWALLVPLYFITGHKLLAQKDDPIIYGHGRTATGWGVALLIIATFWSLTDLANGTAAAFSHTVLAGAVILAAWLWRQPRYLYAASLLSLSAVTFAESELGLTLSQVGLGWASLAIIHIIVALNLGTRFPNLTSTHSTDSKQNFVQPIVVSGYVIAALAILPSFLPYNGDSLAYALGNWLGLTAWGAWLAHTGRPGFGNSRTWSKPVFHWFTALPLPVWLGVMFANRRPLDFSLPLALAVLAWAMVALSYRLARADATYRLPWYVTGLLVSIAAPLTAFAIIPSGYTPSLALLVVGLLYFADAITNRQSLELAPAGLITAWGYTLLLDRLNVFFDVSSLALSLLVAVYILAGLQAERQKSAIFTHRFLSPLYLTAHVLGLVILWRIYLRPFNELFFNSSWTEEMQRWGAASQLLLAITYGLYAWSTYKERWGHIALWLGVAGGGFLVIVYSQGHGSSAAAVAMMAIVLVLIERGLHWLRQRPGARNRQQAYFRLTWRLFRRPLLLTGWIVSVGAIGLALLRNLWWLGGGRIQQIWAITGLLLITCLYALSARLFRQARFTWLAVLLIFAPWTILTNLGWFTSYRPTLPGFALSWAVLAWFLYLAGLLLGRFASYAYVLPLKSVAHALLPLSLLWGVANVDTSRFTVALAVGLYGLAAVLDHRSLKYTNGNFSTWRKTKFLYPTLGLIPVWCVYLLAWLLPTARHEHYGLMLLLFGPLGLIAGQWLERVAPKLQMAQSYGLPGYLTAYGSLIIGTMLVAHEAPLLALALLFDALLLVISARLFRNPLWLYPAAAVIPISLLLALHEAGIAGNRQGWWLIGLASIYLMQAWVLRRVQLMSYSTAPLIIGFALIALGLPPSSQDQTGALWGYGSAALLYTIMAFWLRQPLLLSPACALVIVPYAIGLQKSALAPEYYGLALFPGAGAAVTCGWWLDRRLGSWRDFPWSQPAGWPKALADRLLGWWGLPFYALGFGLGLVSPFFTEFKAGLSALNFLLMMPLFGWAIYYFRLRIWLLALTLAGHLAAIFYLQELGWWHYPAWAWYRFLPVTLFTAGFALFIEQRWRERSPLQEGYLFRGWSRPLYIIALLDIIIGQIFALEGSWAGAMVSLGHGLIIAVLASFWLSRWLPYLSLGLGIFAWIQWLSTWEGPIEKLPIALAGLALGYGLSGYGLSLVRQNLSKDREIHPWLVIWELPLQRESILLSLGTLVLTAWLGLDLVGWTIRAIFGLRFRQIVDLVAVQMVVQVLALLGLLYLTAAFTHRWLRLGYLAIGMLVSAWMVHAFYVQQWENVQWYAIPAGLYLLAIAYLEWQRGHKNMARWLDYAAMILMLGSLFWQTLLFGWEYALLLGTEGFIAFWWGSARRLRRFFYAGMVAVILATVGQLLNSLQSINQWIVFGVIGLLLVVVAIVVERKLESIKAWQAVLETWE